MLNSATPGISNLQHIAKRRYEDDPFSKTAIDSRNKSIIGTVTIQLNDGKLSSEFCSTIIYNTF